MFLYCSLQLKSWFWWNICESQLISPAASTDKAEWSGNHIQIRQKYKAFCTDFANVRLDREIRYCRAFYTALIFNSILWALIFRLVCSIAGNWRRCFYWMTIWCWRRRKSWEGFFQSLLFFTTVLSLLFPRNLICLRKRKFWFQPLRTELIATFGSLAAC